MELLGLVRYHGNERMRSIPILFSPPPQLSPAAAWEGASTHYLRLLAFIPSPGRRGKARMGASSHPQSNGMRNALTQRRATTLRRHATDAEVVLWQRLRRRQILGLRFRRQVPIGPYIADFACLESKIIIEIDGSQHLNSEHDRVRDRFLRECGFRLLRYWSHDVLRETDAVMEAIYKAVKMPPS